MSAPVKRYALAGLERVVAHAVGDRVWLLLSNGLHPERRFDGTVIAVDDMSIPGVRIALDETCNGVRECYATPCRNTVKRRRDAMSAPAYVHDAVRRRQADRQHEGGTMNVTTLDTTDTDTEWHEWRRGGVGGSDIAALIGLSRYASPTSLYFDKLGLLERSENTQRQRIGKRMEAVLAAEFHDETGLHVVGEQTWCTHPELDWARCTVDGFVADSPFGSAAPELTLGTWEAKSDGRYGWPDGIPANIRAQVIWQLGVNQLQHCYLTVMFAGFRIEHHEIPWDADAESDWHYMIEVARTFWFDHIMLGTPPPVDDHEATTDALTQVHRDPAGMLDADDHARNLVATVQSAQATTKAAKAEEDRAKNELRALLGDHTDLIDGWTQRVRTKPKPVVIASWREQQTSKTDMDALRIEAPDLVDKFTTRSTIRVLRVPKQKED